MRAEGLRHVSIKPFKRSRALLISNIPGAARKSFILLEEVFDMRANICDENVSENKSVLVNFKFVGFRLNEKRRKKMSGKVMSVHLKQV